MRVNKALKNLIYLFILIYPETDANPGAPAAQCTLNPSNIISGLQNAIGDMCRDMTCTELGLLLEEVC